MSEEDSNIEGPAPAGRSPIAALSRGVPPELLAIGSMR
jgi:hypothetical protein